MATWFLLVFFDALAGAICVLIADPPGHLYDPNMEKPGFSKMLGFYGVRVKASSCVAREETCPCKCEGEIKNARFRKQKKGILFCLI
jgi:hypothetical protein